MGKAKAAALRNFSGRAKGKCVVQVLASEAVSKDDENVGADQSPTANEGVPLLATDSPTVNEEVEETKTAEAVSKDDENAGADQSPTANEGVPLLATDSPTVSERVSF